MSFRDYSLDPDANTSIGGGIYVGENMARNDVRPALQQLAADGAEVYGLVIDPVDPLPSGLGRAINIAALQGITDTATNMVRYLAEPGREGIFIWSSANNSANVTADTQQGIYVPPATDPTGASGAWVRKFNGAIYPEWFGAVGDGVTNDAAKIQAAIDRAVSLGGGEVRLRAGTYLCSTALTWSGAPVTLSGAGSSLQPNTGTILSFPNSASHTGCIRVQNGASGFGSGSRLAGFRVLGNNGSAVSDGNAATGLGSGILVQAQIETDDVAVENVEGNGYMLLSGSGDVSINCNTGMHRRVQAFGCKKNGFATKGDDSNQNLFIACSSINSGQAGVYENSALGNHYKALHLSGNGSVIRIGNVAKDNTFTAVYKEIDAVGTLVTFDAGGSGRNHIEFTHAEATVSLAVVDNTASQYNLVSVNGQAGGTTWFGDYGATASFQIDKDKILVRKGKTVQFQDAETPTTNFNLTNGGGNFSILTASSGVGIYFGVAGAFQANVQSDGFHVTGIGAFSGALSAASADVTGVYKVAGTQVVGARSTGWAADTGTAKKTATATYTPGSNLTYSASYVQAEQTATSTRLQLIEPALRDATQEIKALKDALIAHGLIGT